MAVATQIQFSTEAAAFDASCRRLREIAPDYPRVYAVATMAEQGKRRWWPVAACLAGFDGPVSARVDRMYARVLEDLNAPRAAVHQVAAALVHAVVGRVAALVVIEARAWDPGVDNLWIHMDSDDGVDWAGVADPILRVIPGDESAHARDVVTLPCERALYVWTAHRCITSLSAVRRALDLCAPVDPARFALLVADTVLSAVARIPASTGMSAAVAARRGQGLLDAFEAGGIPVRTRSALAVAC